MVFRFGHKGPRGAMGLGCACCSAEAQAATARVNGELSRRGMLACTAASIAGLGLPDLATAQTTRAPAAAPPATLLTNLRLFDGSSASLRAGVSVLVRGDKVADIVASALAPPEGARVIDCGGRTLMPGLIDAHWHTMMASMPLGVLMTADVGYIHLAAAAEAERTLMRGFTTVRDLGGPSFALKRAIDGGMIVGPRIYPCGAMISQTGGHGDFRNRWEVPRAGAEQSRAEVLGAAALADSPDDVRRRTREQLMLGATQIKLTAGGGIASDYDPIDVLQFQPEEIRAAVEAAANWGTYVATHVYTANGIRRCVEAGVKCIEHGQLADEDAVRMMADRGVRWCLQPFLREMNPYVDRMAPDRLAKWESVWAGTDRSYDLAKRRNMPIGWGSDLLFEPDQTARQGAWLAVTRRWFTPAQALKMATSDNAAILAMSGPRNPYDGKLGVIEKDALADMLLVDGDPLSSLDLVADPERNFRMIMKGGRIHKNTL